MRLLFFSVPADLIFFGIDIIDSEMTELVHKMRGEYGFRH